MVYMLSEWITGHTVILFLSMSTGILSLPYHLSTHIRDVSYYELVKMNVTCGDLHSCHMRNSWIDDLRYVNCHCGPTCMQLGTCCVDSKYRTSRAGYNTSGVSCQNINEYTVLHKEGCRSDWDGDDFVKDLCLGYAAVLNDPLLLVPVSSSRTGITYRNYFCFVCNVDVDADRPVFWDLKLSSASENVSGYSLPDLNYNTETWSWTVRGNNNTVYINFEMPDRLQSMVKWCREGYTIKTCANNWSDVITKKKCEAYTAEILIPCKTCNSNRSDFRYQNPHCAICNFEDVSNAVCTYEARPLTQFGMAGGIPGVLFVGLFSLENRTIRCPRNTILDTFKNRCRTFRCGRGTVMVDGKCEVRAI